MNPERIKGNWDFGWILDVHTVSSTLRPDGNFDTIRTELGELLYQLKYRYDKSKIRPIAEIAAQFLKGRAAYPDLFAIVPVPPSDLNRPFQPVIELAVEIGRLSELSVTLDYLFKIKQTRPLKNMEDHESRTQQLEGSLQVKDQRFQGKAILLFDDLFRSGETLMAVTDALKKDGNIAKVYVLALTKTRSKR